MAVTAEDNWGDIDAEVDDILASDMDDKFEACIIAMTRADFTAVVVGNPEVESNPENVSKQLMWYASLFVAGAGVTDPKDDKDKAEHRLVLQQLQGDAGTFDAANHRLLKKIFAHFGLSPKDEAIMELVHDFATSLHGNVAEYLLQGFDYITILQHIIRQRLLYARAFKVI